MANPFCSLSSACLPHGSRILQIGFRSLLQSLIVEQPVVGTHHLKDDPAVGVIELKISRQQVVPADGDLLRPLQVEDGVIQNEDRRIGLNRLANEIRPEEYSHPRGLRQHRSCHGRIEGRLGDTQVAGPGLGIFPRYSGVGIIVFGDVDQLRQAVGFRRINRGGRRKSRGRLEGLVGRGRVPRMFGNSRRFLSARDAFRNQHAEHDDCWSAKTKHSLARMP